MVEFFEYYVCFHKDISDLKNNDKMMCDGPFISYKNAHINSYAKFPHYFITKRYKFLPSFIKYKLNFKEYENHINKNYL